MAKKLKFTYAKLKICDYTGNIETDKANAVDFGILKDGLKLELDTKVIETNAYAIHGKILLDKYIESAKVTGTLVEINADKIENLTGFIKKNIDATTGKTTLVLDFTTLTDKLVIVEEKKFNANDEKYTYFFYPSSFTGKVEIAYEGDKEVVIPVEFSVYADLNTEDGDIGLKIDVAKKTA